MNVPSGFQLSPPRTLLGGYIACLLFQFFKRVPSSRSVLFPAASGFYVRPTDRAELTCLPPGAFVLSLFSPSKLVPRSLCSCPLVYGHNPTPAWLHNMGTFAPYPFLSWNEAV